ncbi:MAG: haloacid dehalogenase-like hydrolase [Solobacterium sp.]|jgi:2-hydroxy-3-keto-5-methylthiopentenyl-1-phosphate phosphatase|nr:haloacid dehalogenase-like hydrolase [Solobacterium sp.]MCH4266733.1 haloacid dehalogenase-like hydrolase [Solobacterium sp.]
MKKTAILYDFDKTLCTRDMQEYSLIPELGYDCPGDFWKEVSKLSVENGMDSISAYLYYLKKKFEDQGKALCRDDFINLGRTIELYPGVKDWFQRINDYGKSKGLEVEHYVISSGMSEIIEGTEIAREFTRIYACRYYYDAQGVAQWPALTINYTTKTQYIFRINKQVLDVSNDNDLNAYVDPDKRPVPFNRMIYVADGLTDVPCMKLVKQHGGKSIVVYNPNSAQAGITAKGLIEDGRADYMVSADYRRGGNMEQLTELILDHMSADAKLEDLEGKCR